MALERLVVPGPFGPVEYAFLSSGPGSMDPIQARTVAWRFRDEPELLSTDITRDWRNRVWSGVRRAADSMANGETGSGQNVLLGMVGPSGWGKTDCGISMMFLEHCLKVRAGIFDLGRERDGSQDALEEWRLFSPEKHYYASLTTAYQERRVFPVGANVVVDDPPLMKVRDTRETLELAVGWLAESFEVQRARVQSASASAVRVLRFLPIDVLKYIGLPYHVVPGRYGLVALWAVVEGKRYPLGHVRVPPPERFIRKSIDGLEVARYDGERWMEMQEAVKKRERVDITGGARRVTPHADLLGQLWEATSVEELERVFRTVNGRTQWLTMRCGGDVGSVAPLEGLWRAVLDATGWRHSTGVTVSRRLTREGVEGWRRRLLEGYGGGVQK